MKKSTLLVLLTAFVSLSANPVWAKDCPNAIGAGVVLGEPTGFTFKLWQGNKNAWDAGIAYAFTRFLLIYGDYLWHFPGALAGGKGTPTFVAQLSPYVGVGGVLMVSSASGRTDRRFFTGSSSVGVGARIPLGIEWRPSNPPLGIFLEIVPGMGVVPEVFGFFQGGIGARFYL